LIRGAATGRQELGDIVPELKIQNQAANYLKMPLICGKEARSYFVCFHADREMPGK
jgi:hypothetical protein